MMMVKFTRKYVGDMAGISWAERRDACRVICGDLGEHGVLKYSNSLCIGLFWVHENVDTFL